MAERDLRFSFTDNHWHIRIRILMRGSRPSENELTFKPSARKPCLPARFDSESRPKRIVLYDSEARSDVSFEKKYMVEQSSIGLCSCAAVWSWERI